MLAPDSVPAAPTSAAHRLPYELLRQVIHFSDPSTLPVLAQVCRGFQREAIPLLYEHTDIQEDPDHRSPKLDVLLDSSTALQNVVTLFCGHAEILQGQSARKHAVRFWNRLLELPKLEIAAWVRASHPYYVGQAAEMIQILPTNQSRLIPLEHTRLFEWHLYGEMADEMVLKLTSTDMQLISVHITVAPGSTQNSVDKIERILPELLEKAPALNQVNLFVGYNVMEIGSRSRRMDRARAFQALTERLQGYCNNHFQPTGRKVNIVMLPSSHIFPTSVDAVDRQLCQMLRQDFDKAVKVLKAGPTSPGPTSATSSYGRVSMPHLSRTSSTTLHL
ncbi:hypothetical protein OC845_006468 [Tilletia horrida]|nr:hypothetical protein OC845_006468 [Tilletia horrida]